MRVKRVYIGGAGIVSALGRGCETTFSRLQENHCSLQPLRLFPLTAGAPLPVGEVTDVDRCAGLPRTHSLALDAAAQAMEARNNPPDAIVLGTTTGGILTTEQLLSEGATGSGLYRYHGLTTVAEAVAEQVGCSGPILTVSTACSSGTAAIAIALRLLQSGRARRVLAGGADSLCRLTYFGFHCLQLVSPDRARPMDADRKGMSVAEGAAMLLLTTEKPDNPLAEIPGLGLSCDAFHPAAPHPEGRGAVRAMEAALADCGATPAQIDYINLHGTGTPDNDLAESKAIRQVFASPPPLSSIKGATGHSLAAAGAMEAVVSALAVSRGLMPANCGCRRPDPELVSPLMSPRSGRVDAVLSNSFGFGGNNGSLIVTRPDHFPEPEGKPDSPPLLIRGMACLTGGGNLTATMEKLRAGKRAAGVLGLEELSANLEPRKVRRLKRIARMALSLARSGHLDSGLEEKPSSIFMGTGWGALSETCDFLARLKETEEQFPSPTDFVGSVHNGPAGQVAIMMQATGANITISGGDYSFEQALLTGELLAGDEPCLVLGADEAHAVFSPLFDPSTGLGEELADGGGCFLLQRSREKGQPSICTSFSRRSGGEVVPALILALGGAEKVRQRFSLILAGIPAACRREAEVQLQQFSELTGSRVPVIDYRHHIGQFASASAVAAVLAADIAAAGVVPAGLAGSERDLPCSGRVLILGLGTMVTAMECGCP